MRVCMILEGSYPYVHGGVSSWTHQYIQAMPDIEFVLWCIGADSKVKGKFKYELPKNVVEVHEVFLGDALKLRAEKKARVNFTKEEELELERLIQCKNLDWDKLFELFQRKNMNPVSLLMSKPFLKMLMATCEEFYPYVAFADFFHTIRSMMLPEMYLLTQEVPKADIYHAAATGYSGLLGSLAKWKSGKPFVLTEHGIYTREREEELLRAKWVLPSFKQQWIDLFYTFSACSYAHADVVTALFHRANRIQQEIGCPKEKTRTIENGVHYERFVNVPEKEPNGYMDIGAVVRIAKIKDIKTMIYAFAELKMRVKEARLHILGDVDDEEYFEECKDLIEQLRVEDIIFTGMVNVVDYMANLDFTILTSISEGQPLSVLESFAAKRPCVTTDVGCCNELIDGSEKDLFGPAGIYVPPMDKDRLAEAMYRMCTNRAMRLQMGEAGQKRVERYYTHEISMHQYEELYKEVTSSGRDRI